MLQEAKQRRGANFLSEHQDCFWASGISQNTWVTAPDPLQTHSYIQAEPGAFTKLSHCWKG